MLVGSLFQIKTILKIHTYNLKSTKVLDIYTNIPLHICILEGAIANDDEDVSLIAKQMTFIKQYKKIKKISVMS